jgi:hypothetical protein
VVVQKIGSIVGRFDGISEIRRKIRRSIIRRTGRAFDLARFAFGNTFTLYNFGDVK